MNKLKRNIIYNSIYRLVVLLTPLITSPYLSRTLGAENIGIYSYTSAFSNYFVLFSLLGVIDYGNRKIAQVKNDNKKLSSNFCQLYYLQVLLTIICLIGYFFIIHHYFTDYLAIRYILAIQVASSLLEINWFAFGMEEFKLTSIRSIFIRVLVVICIIIFVKSEQDLWKYTLIMTLGNVISLLIIWNLVNKYIIFEIPNLVKMLGHLKPCLILFLPVMASSIYQQMDKLMLGLYSSVAEVGFYQNAENIVTLPMFLTTAVVTVMLPYTTNMISQGNKKNTLVMLEKSLKYTSILNLGMTFGMIGIVHIFIPWFLGANYIRSAELIDVLAFIIILCGFSNVIRYQYLIPNEYDKLYLGSIIMGAIVNFISNIYLIPLYEGIGASIATVLAYLTVLIIQIYFTRKEINYCNIIKSLLPYFFIAIFMYLIINYTIQDNNSKLVSIIFKILFGSIIYLSCSCIVLKIQNDYIYNFFVIKIKQTIKFIRRE